ncbi:MAG: cation:proton antiporter [archaeon]|nr:cation:proton antiporter [archaeon]
MEIFFVGLAIILLVAFLLAYLLRALRQPIVIGYIIAGIVISPFFFQFGVSKEIIDIFSKFGIAFLLFIVGLHLNPRVIKEIGTTSLLVGFGQIVLTFAATFLISTLIGFSATESIYIGIALSFSSTIIIMKLLSDENQLDSLYGKISIGVLIIQDLVAVGVLMFLSSMNGGTSLSDLAFKSFVNGSLLFVLLLAFGFFVLPKLTHNIAKNPELLFLFSICWCFAVAALFSYLEFSIEVGALLAGVSLSFSPYVSEIISKIKPLRDFFLIIFFIILGLNINLSGIGSIILNAVIFSIIALILKPLILMVLMTVAGYTRRNNFLVGTTLGQISEFSLIILLLGISLGQINQELLSTMTLTAVLTIAISSYVIIYSDKIYKVFSDMGILSIFERKNVREKKEIRKSYDIILFGYNRTGFSILNSLKKMKKSYLVVDFNPDIVDNLKKMRIPALYGDSGDAEFLDELPLEKVQLVISTMPDFEANVGLLEWIKKVNPNAIVIVRAKQVRDATELYKKGADYVLTPTLLTGDYVSKMITSLKSDKKSYKEEKEKHLKLLDEIIKKGNK